MSLTIIGLGPARPEHLTVEARDLLEHAQQGTARVYGLAHARSIAAEVAPDLLVRSLDYLYTLPGVERPRAYQDLAEMLLRRAFVDEQEVLYLVAGSPLFINDAVLMIRKKAADANHPVRLVHGMSFVDLVLDRVYWTGHGGLQLYSAWNIAKDGVVLAPGAPALLCQLGEFSSGGEALDTAGSVEMLGELAEALKASHGADHPVVVLYSSGPPDYQSLARKTTVAALPDEEVPVYSNLWVPAMDGPALEMEVAP